MLDPGGGTTVLTTVAEDGLTVDGEPFTGELRLPPDPGP
ncbi:hypothetical protein Save01_03561 [Streptomyces avermitilis]